MATKKMAIPYSKEDSGKTTAESFGLEVWIEIFGKRAAEEQVDGKRVVVMETDEPNVVTPYSVFVKNNSDNDIYVSLNTEKKRAERTYVVKKGRTREYNSFDGALLGFEVVPLTGKVVGRGTNTSASQVEYRHFNVGVRALHYGAAEWVPPANWAGDRNGVFGGDSRGQNHVGVSRKQKLDKKKVELVSAGRVPDKDGHFSNAHKGEKLGEFKLHYASVTEMAVARERRYREEEEQATSKAKHGAAKRQPDNVEAEAAGDEERPHKKSKVEKKIIDLTSDVEVEDL